MYLRRYQDITPRSDILVIFIDKTNISKNTQKKVPKFQSYFTYATIIGMRRKQPTLS